MAFSSCWLSIHLVFLLIPTIFASEPSGGLLRRCGFSSIYSFGDSVADTGNVPFQFPSSPVGRYPYGMSIGFPGRFSDGFLLLDHIAQSAGLELCNPYLNKSMPHSGGANFAVGGVGALTKTMRKRLNVTLPFSQSSLEIQFKWFQAFLNTTFKTEADKRENLESALFVIGGGGNDYANFNASISDPLTKMKVIMPFVLKGLKNAVKKVMSLGGKRVIVMGLYQGGCLPIGYDDRTTHDSLIHCYEPVNAYHELHNQLLKEITEQLDEEFPDAHIIYGDIWAAVYYMFENYRSLGFKYPNYRRCCGNYVQNKCGEPGVPFCKDPWDFMFWDGLHFTGHAYAVISQKLIPQIFSGMECGVRPRKSSASDESSIPPIHILLVTAWYAVIYLRVV